MREDIVFGPAEKIELGPHRDKIETGARQALAALALQHLIQPGFEFVQIKDVLGGVLLLRITQDMPREQGGGSPEMTRVRKGLDLLKAHLDYVGRLADGRNWLAGDHLSLADLAGAAHFSAIDYIGDVPWADFPSAKAWFQRLKSRPSFRPLLADSVRGMTMT